MGSKGSSSSSSPLCSKSLGAAFPLLGDSASAFGLLDLLLDFLRFFFFRFFSDDLFLYRSDDLERDLDLDGDLDLDFVLDLFLLFFFLDEDSFGLLLTEGATRSSDGPEDVQASSPTYTSEWLDSLTSTGIVFSSFLVCLLSTDLDLDLDLDLDRFLFFFFRLDLEELLLLPDLRRWSFLFFFFFLEWESEPERKCNCGFVAYTSFFNTLLLSSDPLLFSLNEG